MYVLFDFSPEFRRQKEEKNLNRKPFLFSVNLKFVEKTIFDAWREIGEKEGRDRKGREGRRHQGGQREREREAILVDSWCGKNGRISWSQDY